MPELDTLTQKDLAAYFNAGSMRKAHSYIRRVRNSQRLGKTLTANVSGSALYQVDINVGQASIYATCTCPYNWGGYCKHIAAVLLKWIEEPRSFSITEVGSEEKSDAFQAYPIDVIPAEPIATFRPQEEPFWAGKTFNDSQQLDRQQLTDCLDALNLQDLRRIAKTRGWPIKGTKKADIVAQIIGPMTQPGEAYKAVLNLDEEHQQVLRALVILGGLENVQPNDIERLAKAWGKLSYKNATTYMKHLCEAGLAIPAHVSSGTEVAFLPRAVTKTLPPPLEGAIAASTDLTSDAPATNLQFADPFPLVRATNQIMLWLEQSPVELRPPMPRPRIEAFFPGLQKWDYVPEEIKQYEQENKFRGYGEFSLTVPMPSRLLPDDVVERLAPLAGGEAQLAFIYALLVATGMLQPGSPTTIWPEMKELFLRQNEITQRATLSRVYFGMLTWSELAEVLRQQADLPAHDHLSLKRTWQSQYYVNPQSLQYDIARFRYLVLRTLASLPDGQWVQWNDFVPLMRSIWPKFDHTVWQAQLYGRQKPGWYLSRGSASTPINGDDLETWQLAQGNFIQTILTGPLHWLGFSDLNIDDDILVSFRLQGLADLLWGRVEAPPAPRQAAAQIVDKPTTAAMTADADTVIVNPSAISAQAHSLLDRIARLETTTPDQFVYRLDAGAAHQAFEAGVALSEIIADWANLLPASIPEPILAKLTAWWNAYGQVRIYEDVTIIEFADDYALTEMKAVTSLEQYLIAEISPQLVLISKDGINLLQKELEKSGYTPKMTDRP